MDISLTAETGRPIGSRESGRLRAEGKVPAVVYGLGREAVAVTVEWPDLRRALNTPAGLNALIELTVDGDTNLSVVKDLQRDPVRRNVRHVDFLLIDRDAPLNVDVPLNLVGTSAKLEAVKGMVDQLVYTLDVKARPGHIPTQIDVDVSEIELNHSVKVGDITLPDGVSTEIDPETAVAMGSPTRSTLMLQQEGREGDEAADESGS
jgi:large subunit ribosomal protein L25